MKKTLIIAIMLLSGCGTQQSSEPVVPPPATTEMQPFLPAYLEMLQGKRPFPHDNCPTPTNLHDLLIPCDQP